MYITLITYWFIHVNILFMWTSSTESPHLVKYLIICYIIGTFDPFIFRHVIKCILSFSHFKQYHAILSTKESLMVENCASVNTHDSK